MGATSSRPRAQPQAGEPDRFRRTSAALLLLVLTIVVSIASGDEQVDAVLRPLYFAVLFTFFDQIRRRLGPEPGHPFRLIHTGFFVLTLAGATAAALRGFGWQRSSEFVAGVIAACEHGALFLLGLVLLAYGFLLWVPELLESRRALAESYDRTSGALQESERARQELLGQVAEAGRMHALGELAAGVAHDLRNPLAIVKAAAQALGDRPRMADELRQHGEVIRRNVERAERTITSLLELARPRAPELRSVQARELLESLLALIRTEARRLQVNCRIAAAAGLAVDTDATLATQVLLNLVLNALQASPPGSEIVLSARRVARAGGPAFVIAVADRGSGLAPGQRQRIFTPFFTTKTTGTGLGLVSSRKIAEQLGGTVRLYPRTRGGARALLWLARSPVPAGCR